MKKLLAIVVLGLLCCNTSFAYTISKHYWGKGPLKLSKKVVDELEYYFSSGKLGPYKKEKVQKWVPFFFLVSPDGKHFSYYVNPHGDRADVNPHYIGQAKEKCKKKSGQECFVFANGYKIVWDNGSDKKKRRLKKKDIMAGKTLQILQELGFYDGGTTQTKKIEKKKKEKKKETKDTSSSSNLTKELKELNKLYKEGILTKEEFEKAKKKLLN